MNRVYYELADVARERAGSGGGAVFAIGAGVAVVVAIGACALLARHPRLGMELNLFPAAIFGSMFVTIFFHVIRILGRNRDLRRLHRNWAQWRLAGIAPGRVMWASTRRGVLWGGVVIVFLAIAILTSVATYQSDFRKVSVRVWIVVIPGMIDMAFMLTGGVLLDVTQWPKRHHLFHRIAAQFVFGLCGCVGFMIALIIVDIWFRIPLRSPLLSITVIAVVTSALRLIYIGHQWDSAIKTLNGEITKPFW